MRLRRAACLVLLCLAPAGAGAVEGVLGVDTNTQYNSNVFSQPMNRSQDGSFRGGPYVRFQDRTGKLNWALEYKPSYEAFYTLSGINSFYHFADGEISWSPSAATQLFASNSFSFTPTRSSSIEPSADGNVLAQVGPVFTNDQVLQNYFSAGIRHAFTQRWIGELGFQNSLLDYQEERFSDSSSISGQGFVSYALFPTDRVGAGLGATSQLVEPPVLDSSRTNYYQLYGIWEHDFSPTMKLNANAGPTLVQSPESLQQTFNGIPQNSTFALNEERTPTLYPVDPNTCSIENGVVSIIGCGIYVLPTVVFAGQQRPRALTADQLGLGSLVNLPLTGDRPSDGGTEVTYFANIELEKRWKNITSSIAYVRNASTTSGLNQSLITDTYRFVGTWQPSPLWTFTMAAYWTRRESNSDQPQYFPVGRVVPGLVPCFTVDPDTGATVSCPDATFLGVPLGLPATLDGVQATGVQARVSNSSTSTLDNYVVSTQVNRRVTKESYVYLRFTWDRQYSRFENEELFTNATFLSTTGYQRYVVALGFVYEFAPMHLAFE